MSAAQGWLNLALYSTDLQELINPTVVMTVTEPLISSSSDGSTDHWSLQFNCYTPSTYETGYEQFVIEVYSYFAAQLGWITPSSNFYAWANGASSTVSLPIPAGTVITIAVTTDPTTRNTTQARFTVTSPTGSTLADLLMPVTLLTGYPGGGPFQTAWEAPLTAETLELVGTGGTSTTFTSGAGTFRYIPGGGQVLDNVAVASFAGTGNPYYPFPAGLDIGGDDIIHTSERSNMQYSEIVAQSDGSYLQYFAWNGMFPNGAAKVTSGPITFSLKG